MFTLSLVSSILHVGEDRAKIREAILATKADLGSLWSFNSSPDREGLRATFAVVAQNGEAKLIKPFIRFPAGRSAG